MPMVQGTPKLIEPPERVQRLAEEMIHRFGVDTYEKPFEIASILRAYGVRVLSAMGEHAEKALREIADHRDHRVRRAVVEELLRHQDVSSLETISLLALNDPVPGVREAAEEALEALQKIAERIAAEQKALEEARQAPLIETGEDVGMGESKTHPYSESVPPESGREPSEPSASS